MVMWHAKKELQGHASPMDLNAMPTQHLKLRRACGVLRCQQ